MNRLASRKLLIWIIGTIVVLGAAASATIFIGQKRARQQLRTKLGQAREAMGRGRLPTARRTLESLSRRWPREGEVLLLLGRCEELSGHLEAAKEAWEKVLPDDPSYIESVESLGGLLINQGRFTPAEQILFQALRSVPESGRFPVLRALARLLRHEGRHHEVSHVLIAGWSSTPDPSDLLQDLWQNDTEPVPVEAWKYFLDRTDAKDDRVWLGQARLALTTGRYEDAKTWLGRCVEQRPRDPAVWRACLDLAVSTEDPAKFWEATERIPARLLEPWELASLRAWLAARNKDRAAERKELAQVVEHKPSSASALERLAVLAVEAGDSKEAERLQRRKAEVDRALDTVHKLVVKQLSFGPNAESIAKQAEVLGRNFDAQAWALVAAGSESSFLSASKREQLRNECRAASESALTRFLSLQEEIDPSPEATLAKRLEDLRGSFRPSPEAIAAGPSGENAAAPRLHFVDDADAAGLKFVFDNGRTPRFLLPETLSGGVGLIDVNGDGWLDVYCVQGGPFEVSPPADSISEGVSEPVPGDKLFLNQGNGKFRDFTGESGIDRLTRGKGYGMGLAVGDFDNDGHPDLFLTRLYRYVLLRNLGDGRFEDVTARMGLGGLKENPMSAAFADLDNDGDLDLYVCHYMRWDPENLTTCRKESGEAFYCDPAKYERALDRCFRNDRGKFVEVTSEAGFTDPDGRGLGVVAADMDDDNRIDLFVANDGTANFLFHNLGGFRFEDVALSAGVAGNAAGGFHAGMGTACGDLDGDGRAEFLVTNLYLEGTTLYRNLGDCMFADGSSASGLFQATRYSLGFGISIFDAANQGWPYVAIANGNVNDFRPFYPFAMPARLFEGRPGGRLVDVSERAGAPWSVPRLGRGLATGDLDNDGRMDVLIVNQNEPLVYFHNRTERGGHFVTFRLEGKSSNRDGVGARLTLTSKGRRQVAQRLGGGSYLSASDGRIHFGLGAASSVDSLEVRWPSGRVDTWRDLNADTGYVLREGTPQPQRLEGFSR